MSPTQYICHDTEQKVTKSNDKVFIYEEQLNSPVGKWSVEKLTDVTEISKVKESLFNDKNGEKSVIDEIIGNLSA